MPSRSELPYDYSDNRRAEIWGNLTWVGGGPRLASSPACPGSDRERIMIILARAGYTMPRETMAARLVQMLDDPPARAGAGKS